MQLIIMCVIASKLPNVSNVHKFTKAYGSLALLEICDSSSSNRELWLIRLGYWPIRELLILGSEALSLAASFWGSHHLIGQTQYWPLLIGSSKRVSSSKRGTNPQIEFLYISNSNYEIHIHYLTNTQTVYFIFTNFIRVFCRYGHCSLRKSFRE